MLVIDFFSENNIRQIYDKLGKKICRFLLGLHVPAATIILPFIKKEKRKG